MTTEFEIRGPADSSLGKPVIYAGHYDPERLFPLPRSTQRSTLGICGDALPFHGVDVWNAYELSWLDPRGKPCNALATITVPASSPFLIESKSLKLYLNGFMQTRCDSALAVEVRIASDLSRAAGADVGVRLRTLTAAVGEDLSALAGECIDDLPVAIQTYEEPDPAMLAFGDDVVDETLVSHLLKSNCPVTGQPDWATVQIRYRGRRLDRAALLQYLVAYREHAEFHEQCVERIWCDLNCTIKPERLDVHARYTRRGGLDINPFRSSDPAATPDNPRLPRQ